MNLTAQKLIDLCREKKLCLSTAESCTGGMIGGALTDVPGSSTVFDGGFITYSNQAKISSLNVPAHLFQESGAVSREIAAAMAEGALKASQNRVHFSIAVTGIAGPNGGTLEKPVGLVWFGLAGFNMPTYTFCENFSGDRAEIRMQTVQTALDTLVKVVAKIK